MVTIGSEPRTCVNVICGTTTQINLKIESGVFLGSGVDAAAAWRTSPDLLLRGGQPAEVPAAPLSLKVTRDEDREKLIIQLCNERGQQLR